MRDLSKFYTELRRSHGAKIAEETERLHTLFDENIYKAIDLTKCVKDRTSYGAAGFDSVINQIADMREILK
jgi:argininosuccinate lyase